MSSIPVMDKNNVSKEANMPSSERTVGSQSNFLGTLNRFIQRVNKFLIGLFALGVVVIAVIIPFYGNGTEISTEEDRKPESWNQREVPSPIFASAHKQLHPGNMSHSLVKDNDFHCDLTHEMALLNKDFSDQLTEHASGVDVLDEAIRIIDAESYQVYFSVHMILQGHDHEGTLHHKCVSHDVFRQSHGLRWDVLKIPNIVDNGYPAEQTERTDGVFQLQQGDIIFVCLCPGVIEYTPQTTHIGIFTPVLGQA